MLNNRMRNHVIPEYLYRGSTCASGFPIKPSEMTSMDSRPTPSRGQVLHGNDDCITEAGFGLIELIATIVILSVAAVGITTAMGIQAQSAAIPIQRMQAISLAETLMAEIVRQPFSYCDPDDTLFATAASTAACTGGISASQDPTTLIGPMPGTEMRSSGGFDNIADYAGLTINPVITMDGQSWSGFSAQINVQRAGTAFLAAADDGDALRITVTVNAVAADDVVLETIVLDSYRSRHAPNRGQPVL